MIIDVSTLDLLSTLSNDGIIVINDEHIIIYVNESYCNLFGYKREQIINQNASILPRSKLVQTLETAKTVIGDVYGVTPEDTLSDELRSADLDSAEEMISDAVYYISRAPIIQDGKVVGVIATVKAKREVQNIATALNAYKYELEYFENLLGMNSLRGINTLTYDSPRMQVLKQLARKAAACDFPVLLTGETGTGKEVFANAIQSDSLRKDKPFIKVNCPAIPEALLESEFFGYDPGAFTGAAKKPHKGKFELAHTGTIFLDEIGDLSFTTQAKLLRVLQEKTFERIGGSVAIQSDFRIIAATNQDLKQLVKIGKFREDLYYRFNTISIKLPPLREHPEDIPRLVRHMVHELNMKNQTYTIIDEDVFPFLQSLYYEGNVRELKNMVEYAYVLSGGSALRIEHFQSNLESDISAQLSEAGDLPCGILQSAEQTALEHCLIEMNFNCNRVAEQLGISRSTLYRKIKKYNIKLLRT